MAGGGEEKKEEAAGDGEAVGEDPEVVAAREEEMQRRRDKFARMEEEREKVRKGIREKVRFRPIYTIGYYSRVINLYSFQFLVQFKKTRRIKYVQYACG